MMAFLAALSGVGIVAGRMMNAQAGDRIGLERSTLNNYWVGLIVSFLAMLIAGERLARPEAASGVFMYLGGALGVGVVMISSLVALRMPAMRMTLIVFASQIATALILDAWVSGSFSPARAAGCALVLAGFRVLHLGSRNAPSA